MTTQIVKVLADSDLKQNGGQFSVEGNVAQPVINVGSSPKRALGGSAKPVYVVTKEQIDNGSFDFRGGSPLEVADMDVVGSQLKVEQSAAMPVYVVSGGALGGDSEIVYLIRDEFTTARAAGAVAGTAAEPGPGARIVPADVGSNISITGGDLSIAAGTGTWDQTIFGYSNAITRSTGIALFVRHNQALNKALNIGFWASSSLGGADLSNSLYFRNIVGQIDFSEGIRGQAGTAVGTYAAATDYDLAIIMKSTGFMAVIRGGAYTDWTVLNQGGVLTTTPMYAGINVITSAANILEDFYRITQLPAPFHTDASMATLSGVLTGAAKAALDAVVPS